MKTTAKPTVRVALIGPAGAGKTTHAQGLQKALGGDVTSFATSLKRFCRDLYGEKMDDVVFARSALQDIGTTARKHDPDVWVRRVKIPTNRSIFIDDCRFYNEYHFLKAEGFLIVRLMADAAVLAGRRPHMTAQQHLHESEQQQAMFPADVVFDTSPVLHDETEDIARVNRLIEHFVRSRFGALPTEETEVA